MATRPNEFRIYRIKPTKDGAATKWQLSSKQEKYGKKYHLFIEGAKQTGIDENENASFEWKDKTKVVTMKLEFLDVGEILSVLNGIKNQAGTDKGIYHQNPKGSAALSLTKYVKDGVLMGYNIRLSRKWKDEKEALVIQHSISLAEGEVLRVLLNRAIECFYNWS